MVIRPYRLSQLDMVDFTLAGYSVAGEESVILAPELNVAFDIGKCPREALTVDHVLLSHGHMDHAAGLPYYFAQRDFQGNEGGTALVPAGLAGPIRRLMTAWGAVEGHVPPHNIVPMRPGDDYPLRRDLLARAFDTRHLPGSLGFSVIEVRRKLKEQYLGLSGPEIVELKNRGVEITHRIEVPHVAFLGDTGPANYSDIPHVRDARVLLIECTFFEADHRKRARAGKHLHAEDLPGVLEGMACERFVIIHVTRRTNMGSARRTLRKALPKHIHDRITFLMSRKYIEED